MHGKHLPLRYRGLLWVRPAAFKSKWMVLKRALIVGDETLTQIEGSFRVRPGPGWDLPLFSQYFLLLRQIYKFQENRGTSHPLPTGLVRCSRIAYPSGHHMGAAAKFTEDQLTFIRKKYMAQTGRGRIGEVTALTLAKFPELAAAGFTIKQVHNLVRDRGWSALRRKVQRGQAASVQAAIAEVGLDKASALKIHIEAHQRVGQKIVAKAEQFVDGATSAKTLSSAASAAKTGISIVRDALGLGSPTSVSHPTFNFNFAHGPDSPFVKKAQVEAPQPVDVEAVASE